MATCNSLTYLFVLEDVDAMPRAVAEFIEAMSSIPVSAVHRQPSLS